MPELQRPPALHGDSYREALAKCEELPPWLVCDLLAEEASFMLCSDGSVGKSTIAINAAAAMSAGLPVWGQFAVPKPLRVYYIIGERTVREPLRRLQRMSRVVPADPDNLWITDAFSGSCNLLNDAHTDQLLATIARDCPLGPNVLYFDPLYSFVAGALSDDRTGNLLTRSFSRIKAALGCAVWMNHHNVKFRMGDDGKQVRASNPMYGSVWLFNHVTTQYLAEREGPDRTILRRMKDNWGVQWPMITLDYCPDNDVVSMHESLSPFTKAEKLRAFLTARLLSGQPYTKMEMANATGISETQYQRIISDAAWRGRIENRAPTGQTGLYFVRPEHSI